MHYSAYTCIIIDRLRRKIIGETPMAEFNADRLNERLNQLNKEQLATMEKLVEKLLTEMEETRPVPKRSDQAKPPSRAA